MDTIQDMFVMAVLFLAAVLLLLCVVVPSLDREWDRQRTQCEHREAQGYDVNCEVYYDY